jgi:hypothetical protein
MATAASPKVRWRRDRLFYSSVSVACALIVFLGFAPSYYLAPWFDTPVGTPEISPTLHVHGMVFTLWMVIGVIQPLLIFSRRADIHRKLGYGAIAVAILMLVLGLYAAARAMNAGFIGLGDPRAFFAIPFFAIVSFAIIVGFGVAWRKRAETHKRLMLLANTQIIEAAFARLLVAGGFALPPLFFVTADLIIVAGIAYDVITRGRIHKVWLWGGGAVIASQVLRIAIVETAAWLSFADWVKTFV